MNTKHDGVASLVLSHNYEYGDNLLTHKTSSNKNWPMTFWYRSTAGGVYIKAANYGEISIRPFPGWAENTWYFMRISFWYDPATNTKWVGAKDGMAVIGFASQVIFRSVQATLVRAALF